MMSAKWLNVKIWLRYCEGFEKPILKPAFPLVYDLGSDPQRAERPVQRPDGHRLGVRRWMMKYRHRIREEFCPIPEHQAGAGV